MAARTDSLVSSMADRRRGMAVSGELTARAALLGHPTSVFGVFLGSFLRQYGWEVCGLCWEEVSPEVSDDVPFPVANTRALAATLPRLARGALAVGADALDAVTRRVGRLGRSKRALVESTGLQPPAVSYALLSSLAMARWIRRHRPRFVFALEAYPHGLAAALSTHTTRIVMPWGGDIFQYAEASPVIRGILRFSLRRAHLICPGAESVVAGICERYRLPSHRVRAMPWGVDRSVFRPANDETRKALREKYGLPRDASVVLNVRRFAPHWGCHEAMDALIALARRRSDCRCVVLAGGGGVNARLSADARERVKAQGLSQQFLFLPDAVPIRDCADLMALSDVFISLHRDRDMRSWSIVQAAACGAVPVLTDQVEYRLMERDGFRALFVEAADSNAVVDAIEAYLDSGDLRAHSRAANLSYVAEHEDLEIRMGKLMEAIVDAIKRREASLQGGAKRSSS